MNINNKKSDNKSERYPETIEPAEEVNYNNAFNDIEPVEDKSHSARDTIDTTEMKTLIITKIRKFTKNKGYAPYRADWEKERKIDHDLPSVEVILSYFPTWLDVIKEAGVINQRKIIQKSRDKIIRQAFEFYNETGELPNRTSWEVYRKKHNARLNRYYSHSRRIEYIVSYQRIYMAFENFDELNKEMIKRYNLNLTIKRNPRRYKNEDIIDQIKEFKNKTGKKPTVKTWNKYYKQLGFVSFGTVVNRFGSWNKALERAGIKHKIGFSDEYLINQIKEFKDKTGKKPTERTWNKYHKQLGLVGIGTIIYHFGSWNKALEKAGFKCNVRLIILSNEEIIDQIKEFKDKTGKKLTERTWSKYHKQLGLVSLSTIISRFGSWNKALERAGFETRATRAKSIRLSNEEIIDQIKEFKDKTGKKPTEKTWSKYYKQLGFVSFGTVVNRFGSWNKALERAGFETRAKSIRLSNEEIIDQIKEFKDKTGKKPTEKTWNKYHKQLGLVSIGTIISHFGSWNKALELTGYGANIRERISDEEIIDQIKEFKDKTGKKPTEKTWNKYHKQLGLVSIGTVVKHFGSWNKALERAGFETRAKSIRLSNEEIINQIKEFKDKTGKKPTVKTWNKYHKQLGLVSIGAIIYRFGSWNKALRRAGFEK